MKARILEKSEEHLWDEFIKNHSFANIHQTSKWGHFQGKYWIIILEKNNKIIAGTILISRNKWLYCARGPLLDYDSLNPQKQLDALLAAIKPIAKQENAIFLRIDPLIKKAPKFKKFYITKKHFQPEHTLILDLTKKENEILAQMKPKGRYNIRLAEKKGVKIHESADTNAFYKLLTQTTTRDKFQSHDKDFYENMLKTLKTSTKLYLAHYKEKPIAGIIVTFFNDTATYYYGASGNEHRNLMAPYLLQWHAIAQAKSAGLKYYDLFGIAPPKAKNHPWQGVTEFKRKFGGQYTSYAKAQDFPFKKILYLIYRLYKILKMW